MHGSHKLTIPCKAFSHLTKLLATAVGARWSHQRVHSGREHQLPFRLQLGLSGGGPRSLRSGAAQCLEAAQKLPWSGRACHVSCKWQVACIQRKTSQVGMAGVQFFISPLISEDGVEREVNAVDSECASQATRAHFICHFTCPFLC